MKTYVVHRCSAISPHKREIREPIERELNQRPEQPITYYELPNLLSPDNFRMDSVQTQHHITFSRVVMETCRVITMSWVEVEDRDNVSMGYYHKFISYYQIPTDYSDADMFELHTGVDLNERLGTISHLLTEEQFYRQRIIDLEHQVMRLQLGRPETTEPSVIEDLPIARRVENSHFDDEIFEVE